MIRRPVPLTTLDRAAAELAEQREGADFVAAELRKCYPQALSKDIIQAADRAVSRLIRGAA